MKIMDNNLLDPFYPNADFVILYSVCYKSRMCN